MNPMIDDAVLGRWRDVVLSGKRVTVMTGAGISAESGIPTFRGPEGYWTVGSDVYHPQEMATLAMFKRRPLEVWRWYCHRRAVCRAAEPNRGHLAIAELEKRLGDNFTLITQNVDGLHLQAGNSRGRTFEIHGNIDFMRCDAGCCRELMPLPEPLSSAPILSDSSDDLPAFLVCPNCGQHVRPHVLWFDECYDETYYRFESSLATAETTDLLLVIGTSGATTLPNHVMQIVATRGGMIIDINIEPGPFAELALRSRGASLVGKSGELLPMLLAALE